MKQSAIRSVILIPALQPGRKLLLYVKELMQYGLTTIVVVDDGSGEKYQPLFQALRQEGATVLRHTANQGKGCALKTGFRYIRNHITDCTCVVTADSDGQHAAQDVCRMVRTAVSRPDALILGVRDFRSAGVPLKSTYGNRLASSIFGLLYGQRLPDTQTGLRAFGPSLLDRMVSIRGNRFEYEIQMLITCVQAGIPIVTIPIQTIYEAGNAGTHFHALPDSLRILKTISVNFIKFSFSSAIGAVVDLGLAWTLLEALRPLMAGMDFWRILLATAAARTVSLVVNYTLNRCLVFGERNSAARSLPRYLLLCLVIMLFSSGGVYLFHLFVHMDEKPAKVLCDICLFFVNYRVQQKWVFVKKKGMS